MNFVQQLIDKTENRRVKIAVVGDAMTDVYASGHIDGCQDDCPKFVEESRVIVPGGASNAARSLRNWNAEVRLFRQPEACRIEKIRHMVGDKCLWRHDVEHLAEVGDLWRQTTATELFRWAPDAVLISDYDKGFMTFNFLRRIIVHFARVGVPLVADPKRSPEHFEDTIIKCNTAYAARYHTGNINKLVITTGDKSPITMELHNRVYQQATIRPPVHCVNHVGAGDCFGAHLVLALAHGFSLVDAAEIAHSAGRVYVQYPHNRPPEPLEVERY